MIAPTTKMDVALTRSLEVLEAVAANVPAGPFLNLFSYSLQGQVGNLSPSSGDAIEVRVRELAEENSVQPGAAAWIGFLTAAAMEREKI